MVPFTVFDGRLRVNSGVGLRARARDADGGGGGTAPLSPRSPGAGCPRRYFFDFFRVAPTNALRLSTGGAGRQPSLERKDHREQKDQTEGIVRRRQDQRPG